MSPPLVRITVPCCNAGHWVAATLESTLAQTWPAKEIKLAVNAGLTDGAMAVVQDFSGHSVKEIDQPNCGAAAARNAGLRGAQGEFIQYVDTEDLLPPGKISAQMKLLAGQPERNVATCAWGRCHDDPAQASFVDETVFRDYSPVDSLALAGETGAMMRPSAWLVTRAAADRVGPRDESLSLNDDGEYFCRGALASAGMAFCDDPGARSFYRSSLPDSLSQRRNAAARQSQFHSVGLIARWLTERENFARARRACAGYLRRFVHDFYPASPDLIARAEAEIVRLGEAVGATLRKAKAWFTHQSWRSASARIRWHGACGHFEGRIQP